MTHSFTSWANFGLYFDQIEITHCSSNFLKFLSCLTGFFFFFFFFNGPIHIPNLHRIHVRGCWYTRRLILLLMFWAHPIHVRCSDFCTAEYRIWLKVEHFHYFLYRQAGVRGRVMRYLGTFENLLRKHRTAVYILVVTEELEQWEDKKMMGKLIKYQNIYVWKFQNKVS